MSLPFLVEIGTEELPPKALKALHEHFAAGIASGLKEAGLAHEKIHAFGAPRRLAVLVENLELRQADQQIEKLGPNVANAFDADGKPTKATEGFARSCGIAVEQLQRTQTDKGERLVFRSAQEGKFALDLLPGIVTASLDKLPIPKRMRWGAKRAEFVRPVHWLVMLLGKQVVDAEILGIKAGRDTRGHRFHANRNFPLANALDYQLTLEKDAKVIADFNERRGHIRAQVEQLGRKFNGTAVIDENLLDEVTGLVEWPVALAGNFEERFLAVPPEALISSMKEHQKYFHVVDASRKLLPHFITIANIESKDPAKVIDGNERVIRPRLSDAAFFYETDLKTPLIERREKLKSVVFQEKLGTVFEKTERIAQLAGFIAEKIHGNSDWAKRAGALSKADLVSNMVGEFDDMQGIAGTYYALHDGEPNEVAHALREHYQPRFAGDELPATTTGAAVALADRLDTLVGIFGIGQPPTGSKDPFALRRAALGVLRLIVEKNFDLDLRELLQKAQAQYPQFSAQSDLAETILAYMLERFRAWFEDENIPAEVFMAVSAKQLSQPLDINQRVQAVFRFSQLPEAQALAAANKRVSNILAKQSGDAELPALQMQLLTESAEKELAQQVTTLQQKVQPLFAARHYREGLEQLASLRGAVDAFFDNVMVMADDLAVRNNRLALLSQLRNLFLEVADISLLAPTTK
ncbi:MAG: glycine--tRNA ligase subunit beta [Verrucomicrobiaceae bacterium]|nr:glycine--tRNA ligase subunit beta [Verrucomicrobiaceae bacterium]